VGARPAFDRDDEVLILALQQGDEKAFTELVGRWSSAMMRMALARTTNHAIAEEVVQDAWLTMLRSLNRFERRSTLRTWVLGIVVNIARARSRAERRLVALPADADGPTVEPSRFLPADHPRWPHHWAVEPTPWRTPEDELLAVEIRALIAAAIADLPITQREVLVLRDVEGIPAADACNILGLTDTNQRVLLHRARARLRHALERHLGGGVRSVPRIYGSISPDDPAARPAARRIPDRANANGAPVGVSGWQRH
jgi:RNA polymerase sigma-70 factor (ECF subfamily)